MQSFLLGHTNTGKLDRAEVPEPLADIDIEKRDFVEAGNYKYGRWIMEDCWMLDKISEDFNLQWLCNEQIMLHVSHKRIIDKYPCY